MENNTQDISELIKQISGMLEKDNIPSDIKNIISNMNTSKDETSSASHENNFGNIDISTILKMKTIIDNLNTKDDPRANLLRSLKPYLKDSKKSKIDQYIQFINISKILEIFKNSGDDYK